MNFNNKRSNDNSKQFGVLHVSEISSSVIKWKKPLKWIYFAYIDIFFSKIYFLEYISLKWKDSKINIGEASKFKEILKNISWIISLRMHWSIDNGLFEVKEIEKIWQTNSVDQYCK